MNKHLSTLLHLNLIDDVGPSNIEKIAKHHHTGDSIEHIYTLSAVDLMYRYQITERAANKIHRGLADVKILEKEVALIEKHRIQIVTLADAEYPALLKAIHLPPPIIYVKGTLPSCAAIAVVGSRDANDYGKIVVDRLVPPVVDHGWAIISGGARGIDSMAHVAAMKAGGKTVAVLGCGFLKTNPSQKKLLETIVDTGGALVSTFPLTMQGWPHNFPARNRIISGMSKGCLVMQAAAQSGARITADFALDQGRQVFAVPGLITDPLSEGCHALIQEGAKLVTGPQDILTEFGYIFTPAQKVPEQLSIVYENPLEEKIVTACCQATSLDELLELTQISFAQLNNLLFELQLKKLVTQNAAGLWQKC